MKKQRKKSRIPVISIGLFAVAAVLLLGSTIGSARAALTYYSQTYTSRVQMQNIGVTLLENGEKVSWRDYSDKSNGSWNETTGVLLENMLGEGEKFQIGKVYQEELSVTNSGSIDQYVRVNIYKYWTDENGDKLQELSPDLINLNLVNIGNGWVADEASATAERTVLYYDRPVAPGAVTLPFSDKLKVENGITAKVTQTEKKDGKYTTITTTYDYDGVRFQVEVEVNAVQTHNAEDAIWSAWGRKATVGADGTLRLN